MMDKNAFETIIAKYQELANEIETLREFVTSNEEFNNLDALNKDLLVAQIKAMETYFTVLSIRIGYNAPQNNEEAE